MTPLQGANVRMDLRHCKLPAPPDKEWQDGLGGGAVVGWRGRELAGVFELGTGMSCWGWGGGGGRQVSMSPVEDVCLVVEAGDVARVCGLKDGRSLGADLKHAGGILRHAFSEDGVWVATAGHDGRMLVWDWRRGELVCPPLVHGEEVVNFVFGGDGTWVATLSRAGVVRVWSTEHGFLLSPDWGGLELGASAELVDWGGNLLVVAGVRGWVWEMGDGEGWGDGVSREEAGLAGEVLSGLGGERGELLGSGAWAERVERLRGAWPAWFRVVRGG
ncbi:MAG: hypothetical protein RI897_4057 [Verrucomicrobiota bacterium]